MFTACPFTEKVCRPSVEGKYYLKHGKRWWVFADELLRLIVSLDIRRKKI